MSGGDVEEYRRSEVGFVWQQTSRNLFPYLTAIENVSLPMMLTRTSGAERKRRAAELLELVGLADRMGHKPETLSGGEQQRVAIAVALANKPPLLLADEPMGELDDATASEILEVFRGVNTELGTTVLIVTHDPDIAYKVGRLVMIRDGKIATEIKRKVSYRREQGEADDELDELTVVDPAGRVQLPRDDLDRVRIRDRARVIVEEDRLNIVPEDYQE